MAYTINLSNGNSLLGTTGLPDGTIDTSSSSLTLIGKNYPGYGTFLNENFVYLLENFAKSTSPANPIPGQLWWDSGNKILNVNAASAPGSASWKSLAAILSSSSAPSSPNIGDQWWNTSTGQLNVYAGTLGWTVIGPLSSNALGTSGAIPDTLVDTSSQTHVVIKFYVSSQLVGVWSKDSTFSTTVTGLSIIRPGVTLVSGLSQGYFGGNADIANNLNVSNSVVSASNFIRKDIADTTTNSLTISNNIGIIIGANGDNTIYVDGSGVVRAKNTRNNADFVITINNGGLATDVLKANATLGKVEVYSNPTTTLGVATKGYVDSVLTGGVGGNSSFTANLVPTANLTYNLGSTTSWWNNIYGTAIHAQYADLAERFESDEPLEPGTVVEIGGDAEITAAGEDLSENVFGVISTRAAYLMNSGAGSDTTHPPVAVQGRVPVKVTGKIRKGDRLVSAGNGLARSAAKSEITPWNVIGRALASKETDTVGVVEAIVKINS